MDTLTTLAVVYGAAVIGLGVWLGWITYATVRWTQVERVKITLAEQEEALSSLFDKLNTVLARWRKREQREEKRADDHRPPPSGDRKAHLRRRAAELRGLPHPGQLTMEAMNVGSDQGSESN